MEQLRLDGNSLDLSGVVAVARAAHPVGLDDAARTRMAESHAFVTSAAAGDIRGEDGEPMPIYGVNTGFGSLARIRLKQDQMRALSWNMIRSHAAGVGKPVAADVVRGMMLLRANALAKGASGCRAALVDSLVQMLNRGVIPEVPSQGSCGSSGDLAPLAHLALVVFRGPEADNPEESGWAWFEGERLRGSLAMKAAGIERIVPEHKDGLAMCNGAQLTTSIGALALHDSRLLVHAAEIAAAMSWEALRGVTGALTPEVHRLRPYPGGLAVVDDLRSLLQNSQMVDSLPGKVQDAYSLRCTPEVVGAVRDAMGYVGRQIAIELNAATDNPLILLEIEGPNKAVSAGLFHGEPVGMVCDHLKLAVSELAAISERRTYRLTTGSLSGRLPPLLVQRDRPGMGLMVPQTTAAALVSENRSLAWPASVDSIPTCEDQEDLVAMSTTAARRAAKVVDNARLVIAIELLSAAHGLWWWRTEEPRLRLGDGTEAALMAIEDALGGRDSAATPAEDINRLDQLIRSGALVRAVCDVVGPLREVGSGA